jgi:hypothetical protein
MFASSSRDTTDYLVAKKIPTATAISSFTHFIKSFGTLHK